MLGSLTPNALLTVQDTGTAKGRGVFTRRAYARSERVETCPVLLIHAAWSDLPKDIKTMVYDWTVLQQRALGEGTARREEVFALALGVGSLFNHDDTPNLTFSADLDSKALVFLAARDIPAGAELTIDYNADVVPEDGGVDWFEALGIARVA